MIFETNSIIIIKVNKEVTDIEQTYQQNEIVYLYHVGKANHCGSTETFNKLKEKYDRYHNNVYKLWPN